MKPFYTLLRSLSMVKVTDLGIKLCWSKSLAWLKKLLIKRVVDFNSDKSSVSEMSVNCLKSPISQLIEILQTLKVNNQLPPATAAAMIMVSQSLLKQAINSFNQQQLLENLSNSTYYQLREVNGSLTLQPCTTL